MKASHEKVIWVEDDNGQKYTCVFNDEDDHSHDFNQLTDEEKECCSIAEFPWN